MNLFILVKSLLLLFLLDAWILIDDRVRFVFEVDLGVVAGLLAAGRHVDMKLLLLTNFFMVQVLVKDGRFFPLRLNHIVIVLMTEHGDVLGEFAHLGGLSLSGSIASAVEAGLPALARHARRKRRVRGRALHDRLLLHLGAAVVGGVRWATRHLLLRRRAGKQRSCTRRWHSHLLLVVVRLVGTRGRALHELSHAIVATVHGRELLRCLALLA